MSEEKTTNPEEKSSKNTIAVILLRGFIGMKQDVKDTLYMLRLRKKHVCVVLEDNPSNKGMITKIKDYVTFGEISDETLKELITKRGSKYDQKTSKGFFELHPPRGGFERKGIKKPYQAGGALGNRGTKINDLIKKML